MDPNKFTEKTLEALNAAQEQAVEHNHQQARCVQRKGLPSHSPACATRGATASSKQCVLLGDF
jgi:hypothetical protein